MQLGTPVTSAWFVLWTAVALALGALIYLFTGSVPYQP
jgi:hypothetical protein